MDEAGTHRTLVGPKNWSATVYEMDVRPGGVWRYKLAPDAVEKGKKPLQGDLLRSGRVIEARIYRHIHGSELEFRSRRDMLTSVAFEEDGDGTRLSIITHFASAKELEARKSWEWWKDTRIRWNGSRTK